MNKILVTGASGQLGLTLKNLSLNTNYQWVFTTKEKVDITDINSISTFFANKKFDFCVNCAAYTNVEGAESEIDESNQVNVEGVQNLVIACNLNQTILIHISTDYVFDGLKKTPYIESDPTAPLNQYGKSKLLGELQILQNSNSFYIIRTSWLYSKKISASFYSSILTKAKKGDSLTVVNDQKGTPTDAENLANFILKIIEKQPEKGIYHFSDEKIMSWFDLAVQILKEHGLDNEIIPIKTTKTKAVRPKYTPLISTKMF